MHIVYADQHKAHDTEHVLIEGQPLDSFDVPARAKTILETVRSAQLGSVLSPGDHGLAPILAVHDPDYVEFLGSAYAACAAYFGEAGPVSAWVFAVRHAIRKPQGFMGRKGNYAFGWGTPILEGTWQPARYQRPCVSRYPGGDLDHHSRL
jgi:acetoin utilization deacetylase AcuC-like enzyme